MQRTVAILPEGKIFDRVFEEALAGEGREVTRVGAEFSRENQLGAACGAIEAADLVVAELTGRNPNVMFLLGYAMGIGKKALMLTRHGEDFPFDKTKHAVIVYSGDLQFLKSELARSFAEDGRITGADSGDARQKFESTFGDILAAHHHVHRGEIQMENPATFVLLGQEMELALVQDLARRARELGLRLKLM